MQGHDGVDLQELRPVKQFKWLLEDMQKLTFAKWLKMVVPAHASFPAITSGKAAEKTNDVAGGHGASSSSGAAAPVASSSAALAPARKKSKTTEASSAESKQALLAKFFPK